VSDTVRIHPENNKCFEYKGKPLVFITATEHYGAVMNRPFRFERYLADAGARHHTLTRLFVLFRELQASINPYSTCKPESPDYIAPFARTGPGRAQDGEPKFDLNTWNPEFFDRLHRFVSLAAEHGVVVEVVIFSNTYSPAVWALNPLNDKNNINGLPAIRPAEYITLRYPEVVKWQKTHARKIIEELNPYGNVIFQICNEPGAVPNAQDAPTVTQEVDAWQREIAKVIRDTEAGLPNKHLIAGSQCWILDPFEQGTDVAFGDLPVDIVNVHPLPDIVYGGACYNMGVFMAKQLCLRPLRDFCLASSKEKKPVNLDEDNAASQYKDFDGWTIHRKRAWTALMCGCHYDYIDFSIINYCETGTEASQACIRTWFKHLSDFAHSVDLARARPRIETVKQTPDHVCPSALAVEDEDYCIYLADERELGAAGAGERITGEVVVDLPGGSYEVAAYSPQTGLYSPSMPIQGGANTRVRLPSFVHDVVLRIRKAS